MKSNQYRLRALTGLAVAIGSLLIGGCTPDYQTKFDAKHFEVVYKDRGVISMTHTGGEKTLHILSNVPVKEWTVEANADWIKLTPSKGQVLVEIPEYTDFGARKGDIYIAYGHKAYTIHVEQTSPKSVVFEVIGLSDPKAFVKTLPAAGGEVSIQVRSNAPITDIVIPDSCAWMQLKDRKDLSDGVVEYSFTVAPSEGVRPRYASAYLYTSSDISKVASFSIKQKNIIYNLIPLRAEMFSTNAQEPSEGPIKNICDGDATSYFHTLWSKASEGGKPHYLQIALDNPISDLKVEYSSRHNGDGGGDIKRAEVYTSETGGTDDSEWTKVGTMHFPLPGGRKAKSLSNERIKFEAPVKHIRLVPVARRNADPIDPSGKNGWFNMGEIYLWTTTDL